MIVEMKNSSALLCSDPAQRVLVRLKNAVFTAFFLLATSACAALPDTQAIIARHSGQAAQFENARGVLSAEKSAAIVADLKRKSGDIDILDKQIALEQAIIGSPLILGNKVTLLQDGASTYAAMFAAIRKARDHINLESYIIEDDEIGVGVDSSDALCLVTVRDAVLPVREVEEDLGTPHRLHRAQRANDQRLLDLPIDHQEVRAPEVGQGLACAQV